jgi:hypothetical protein
MPRLRRGDGFPVRRSADLADRGKKDDPVSSITPGKINPTQCEANLTSTGYVQVDPEPRNLLRLGANQSLHNDGPTAAYAFYYWNVPNVSTTNTTLHLAMAPVYADGELGFKGLFGRIRTWGWAFSAAASSIVTLKCGKGITTQTNPRWQWRRSRRQPLPQFQSRHADAVERNRARGHELPFLQ